ncbi:MAG: hypothetical protein JW774_09100 [Candidatus Aureabacteria bacterium]|nr:hypothetical protein [Candidatus Auribacterota bacterium]
MKHPIILNLILILGTVPFSFALNEPTGYSTAEGLEGLLSQEIPMVSSTNFFI